VSGPLSFDRGPPFELKAKFAKEINRRSEIFNNDSYVVHRLSAMFPISKVSSSPTMCMQVSCWRKAAIARSDPAAIDLDGGACPIIVDLLPIAAESAYYLLALDAKRN
jgi:hypothetical protein